MTQKHIVHLAKLHQKTLHACVALMLCLPAMFGTAVCAQQNGAWVVYNTRSSDIGGNNISAICADRKGLWVGTYNGLCKLQGASWTDYAMFNQKLKNQSVNCLTTDSKGMLWVGTDDYGVIEFDGTNWIEHSVETHRLKMKFVKEIVEDVDGVMWIGVTLGGVVSYDGHTWEKYTPDDCGLLSDFVLDLAVDRANRKWITTNEGISVYNGRRWVSYTTDNSGLPDNIVPAVAIDRDNNKWFGTLAGLVRFDGEEWTVWNTQNSPLPGNQVNDLAFDNDGLLWIATDKGVAVFDGVDRWDAFTPKNTKAMPNGNIYKVTHDRHGAHWFGSDTQGLLRLVGYTLPEKEVAPAPVSTTEEAAPASSTPKASDEKIRINPHLDAGYITITMESATANVRFINSNGKVVKSVKDYKSGQRINIARLSKGMYQVSVSTARGERKIKFNLK